MATTARGKRKRNGQWMAERNRKQARGGSTRVDIADARGSPMILATFDGGNEFNASRELLDVLNAHLEAASEDAEAAATSSSGATAAAGGDGAGGGAGAGASTTTTDMDTTKSFKELLAAELGEGAADTATAADDAKKGTRKTFKGARILSTGVRGIVIAAMPVKANVVEIVQAVLQRYKTSGVTTSRYLVRMYPLQVTCAGQMKTLLAALNPLLDAHFARAETPKSPTFAIEFKARNCGPELSRGPVIEAVAAAVGTRAKVDLTTPDIVVIVQGTRNTVGVAVVEGAAFRDVCKYNVRMINEPAADRKKRAAQSKASKLALAKKTKAKAEAKAKAATEGQTTAAAPAPAPAPAASGSGGV